MNYVLHENFGYFPEDLSVLQGEIFSLETAELVGRCYGRIRFCAAVLYRC